MIVLKPAYGREYKTIEEAEHDWNAGKDFKILQGPYCSIRDMELLKDMGHTVVLTVDDVKINKIILRGS